MTMMVYIGGSRDFIGDGHLRRRTGTSMDSAKNASEILNVLAKCTENAVRARLSLNLGDGPNRPQ